MLTVSVLNYCCGRGGTEAYALVAALNKEGIPAAYGGRTGVHGNRGHKAFEGCPADLVDLVIADRRPLLVVSAEGNKKFIPATAWKKEVEDVRCK